VALEAVETGDAVDPGHGVGGDLEAGCLEVVLQLAGLASPRRSRS